MFAPEIPATPIHVVLFQSASRVLEIAENLEQRGLLDDSSIVIAKHALGEGDIGKAAALVIYIYLYSYSKENTKKLCGA